MNRRLRHGTSDKDRRENYEYERREHRLKPSEADAIAYGEQREAIAKKGGEARKRQLSGHGPD